MDYLTTHPSLSPIRRGFATVFLNYKKGCTRLATASDKVYQLLAHGRWFSSASSTTKTGRHDIAEILLKVALNIKNQSNPMRLKNLFSLDRYLVDTGSNYIDIYGIVKSVWFRQVFSLLRVRFRQISLYKYVLHCRSRYEEGGGVWAPISWFNSTIFLCLSKARICISNNICYGPFFWCSDKMRGKYPYGWYWWNSQCYVTLCLWMYCSTMNNDKIYRLKIVKKTWINDSILNVNKTHQ